jgi:hypothetical protein
MKKPKSMTLKRAEELVQRIRGHVDEGDFDLAHRTEDDLYRGVICAIIANSPNARKLALLAWETHRINFDRHSHE